MTERLQKILAARGIASRREAEIMIAAGRVTINGRIATEPGSRADPAADEILLDGRPLPPLRTTKVLMLNKPVGYLSTCRKGREEGRIILDLIPNDRRYFPVGRLDQDSSGLILLTDDGELAHRLTHPSFGTRKVYIIQTRHMLSADQVRHLRDGVMLDDGPARPEEVVAISLDRLRLTMTEGRKREIRRMIAAVGTSVIALERVQIGNLRLGSLPSGQWRELNADEIERLVHSPASTDKH